MRRASAVLALTAAVLAGCGDDPVPAAPAAGEEVVLALDEDGSGGEPAQTRRVRCSGAGNATCRALRAVPVTAFSPVPAQAACTQLFGGPQRARIAGTIEGRRVAAVFSRRNGCEIARWDRIAPVLDLAFPGRQAPS